MDFALILRKDRAVSNVLEGLGRADHILNFMEKRLHLAMQLEKLHLSLY